MLKVRYISEYPVFLFVMKTLDSDKHILVCIIGGYTFHVFLLFSLLYTIIRVITRNFLRKFRVA